MVVLLIPLQPLALHALILAVPKVIGICLAQPN
jgi:hypothetical protein